MKGRSTWNPEADDATLKELWQQHHNLALCAELMGHSKGTVYARAAKLRLGEPPRRPTRQPRYEERDNPLAVARWILGTRLTETPGCFVLDGTPATLATVMKAANRALLAADRKQITVNPVWVVHD